ncbi:CHASE2 domain-containing protein [Geitlerinema sp. P-1104]|nr:CHASE2 domain-containing protein [Geitlerinema sp. P-1104]
MASMLVTSLVMGGRSLGWLQSWELNAWDALSDLRPSEPPDRRLLLVKINELDVRQLNEYPINNEDLLRVLKKIDQYNPRLIGINLALYPAREPGRQALIEYLQDHDRVISVCNAGEDDRPQDIIYPLPGVSSSFLGFTDLTYDEFSQNNPVRRHLLKTRRSHPCNTNSSFSYKLALKYLEEEGYTESKTSNKQIEIGNQVIPRVNSNSGGYQVRGKNIEDFDGYQTLINYRQSNPIAEERNVAEILDGSINTELHDLVRDRIVLIGNENIGTNFYSTPNLRLSHVDVNAHLTSQIISAVLDERPLITWWSQGQEALWIWIWSSIGSLVAWLTKKSFIFTLGIAIAAGSILVIGFVFLINGVWIPTIPAILALILTGLGILFYKEAYV